MISENSFKKIYIFCFVLFLTVISPAQEISFELFLKDNCKDTIQKVPFFTLTKNSINYYPSNDYGVVILDEKGVYELSTMYFNDPQRINVDSYGSVKDTIQLHKIQKCYEPTSHPNFFGYCCCGFDCEGENVDYYINGNKRIEGYFENGKPIGKLLMYYPDGSIKQIDRYNKNGKLIRSKKFKPDN